MKKFFSCDWGTSSFRLKLIEANTLGIIAAETSSCGISQTFELWRQSKQKEESRISFYAGFIRDHIKIIEQKLNTPLDHLSVIISGMASSNIGVLELSYKKLPFAVDGSDLLTKHIKASASFPHDIFLISGACTNDDVMRGEETQLAGCNSTDGKGIYIFPGTHSKHVFTENGFAVDCKTYMTGEFFELLSTKSILSSSVEHGNGLDNDGNLQSFGKGVSDGIQSNLLNSSFRVRTNILFNKHSKQENYYYLSGLLIGAELKELLHSDFPDITVVASREQWTYYEEAFHILRKSGSLAIPSFQNVEEATINGQWMIASPQPPPVEGVGGRLQNNYLVPNLLRL